MTTYNRTYREENGRIIRGVFLPVIIRNGQSVGREAARLGYVTSTIKVYEDGLIDCWKLVDLDTFRAIAQSGWLVTSLPEGARIYLGESTGIHLTASEITQGISLDDLIKQVEDEIRALRGEPTTSDVCIDAYIAYLEEPSDVTKTRLLDAYEKVPSHLREYLRARDGQSDFIDDDIRALNYEAC